MPPANIVVGRFSFHPILPLDCSEISAACRLRCLAPALDRRSQLMGLDTQTNTHTHTHTETRTRSHHDHIIVFYTVLWCLVLYGI